MVIAAMHFSQTNPPFYAPLVELVPSPWADSDVVPTAKAVMEKIGQVPVILKKEIEGFVLNRIQYSILKESWRLIKVRFLLISLSGRFQIGLQHDT